MDSKGLQELTDIYLKEISANTALRASKEADKARGKAAASGDKEKAKAKAAQASRLYKASAEKRKSEPVATPDRSYPKGKGASYQEDKDWGYDEDGNSLNPVDIEKRKKEDDDLAGAPNKKKGKKAKKDYDGDNELESPEDEYKGSKDKAIKKAMKEEIESIKRLIESGKFSNEEIESMAWDIYEGISASGYARAKKYREDQAREKDKKEQEYFAAKAKTHKWDGEKWNKREVSKENYQAMRNPEKEEQKDKRSAREKRMADPKKGINSPAFKEFMRQQGM